MKAQSFDLNLVPGGVPVYVHADQYDTERVFTATMWDGDEKYVFDGTETIELRGTKRDRNGFIEDETTCSISASGSVLTFPATENMTDVYGDTVCSVVLSKDGIRIGTANFVLKVQESSLEAETVIHTDSFNDIIVSALSAKGLLVTDTASGSLASFPDGADGMPVVSITTDPAATEIYRAGKNILPFPYRNSSSTSSGATRTVNDDGTISLSGTATAESSFIYTANLIDVLKPNIGDVLVFTDGLTYASNRYSRVLWADNMNGIGAVNGSLSVTITQEHLTRGIYYGMRITSGANCNGLTVKPMVRIYGDDTYEPYAVETFAVGDDVTTVHGANSIWADTGDVSVEYVADTKMYIDKQIAELQALVLES